MFLESIYPSLDLHGMDREITRILVKEFVQDQFQLGTEKLYIIHGRGTGVLRNEVQQVLSKLKIVKRFYIDFFNDGCTVVELKKKS